MNSNIVIVNRDKVIGDFYKALSWKTFEVILLKMRAVRHFQSRRTVP